MCSYFKTSMNKDELNYEYKISDGISQETHYGKTISFKSNPNLIIQGIQLAKNVGLDASMVECALRVSQRIRQIFEDRLAKDKNMTQRDILMMQVRYV